MLVEIWKISIDSIYYISVKVFKIIVIYMQENEIQLS